MENLPPLLKSDPVWDALEKESNGLYSENLGIIARTFPILKWKQLRVAALKKAGLTSMQISAKLRTHDHNIDKITGRIRKNLNLARETDLKVFLAALEKDYEEKNQNGVVMG